MTEMGVASGMSKQQLSQIITEKRSVTLPTLRKVSMLLYCPTELLVADDPSPAIRFPLPPPNYLETIRANRDFLGFEDSTKIPDWETFAELVNRSMPLDR
jgi:transcriptional regulator with XRE-family HTH domain